jgi:hypothetical protein
MKKKSMVIKESDGVRKPSAYVSNPYVAQNTASKIIAVAPVQSSAPGVPPRAERR